MVFMLLIVSGLMAVIAFFGGMILAMRGHVGTRRQTSIPIIFLLIITAIWGWYFLSFRPAESARTEGFAAIANDPGLVSPKLNESHELQDTASASQ